MSFIIPTLLQVRGMDDNNEDCVWYAEAVGRIKKNDQYYYEGYYLVPSKTNPSHLVYDETYDHIPEDSVMTKLSITNESYELAWEKMGVLMNKSGNETYFLKVGEPLFAFSESNDDKDDIGSIDSYSTESDDRSNISDLIDDSEIETVSCNNETKTLNEQFKDWVPKDGTERRVKSFIESLEHRAAQERDERAF
tara:strand:- start:12636 stop:13217 length:582 start_codon:yes stop_codon:yes gene_type:complete